MDERSDDGMRSIYTRYNRGGDIMPKSLLGRCVYMFIGCAACMTLICNALCTWAYCRDWMEEHKSEKEEADHEVADEDDI